MRNLPPRLTVLLVLSLTFISSQLWAYKVIEGPKWDLEEGPIGYFVDPAGSEDITDGSDVEAVKQGFQNWQCVLCSSIQFRYDGDNPAPVATGDGQNSVGWAETEEAWPFGPGTLSASVLGICAGGGGPNEADIAFNGADHTWSTTDPVSGDADVGSIAIHEEGHFLGLDHPCTDESETDCLPTEQAVMNPIYPGGIWRTPNEDDQAGVCALYPPGKDSCDEGKVIGSKCEKNCECEPGLQCIMGLDDQRYCSRSCRGDETKCPRGMACMLAARPTGGQGGPAPGACVMYEDASDFPASMACERDTQCRSRNCGLVPALGRTACVQSCASVDQCDDGYVCRDMRCVKPTPDRGVPCPEEPVEEPGCGCQSAAGPGAIPALFLLLPLFVGGLLRRRKSVFPLLFVALFMATQARATVVENMDLARMIELSDTVVRGHVVSIQARKLKATGLIVQDVTLAVNETIIGAQAGAHLTFFVPGGELDGRTNIVPGVSHFAVGEEVVMFLSRWQDRWVQIAVGVGKLRVERRPGQEPSIVDELSGVATYGQDHSGQVKMMGLREAMPSLALEDFRRELKARAQQH